MGNVIEINLLVKVKELSLMNYEGKFIDHVINSQSIRLRKYYWVFTF